MPFKRSRPFVSLICTFTLMGTSFSLAEVYKSYDETGAPVFSDEPSNGAEKVIVPQTVVIPAIETPEQPEPLANESDLAIDSNDDIALPYDSLIIESPAAHEVVSVSNGQGLDVLIKLSPHLKSGDQLELQIEGSQDNPVIFLASAVEFRHTFTELDEGNHVLLVQIRDEEGKLILSSKRPFSLEATPETAAEAP